MNKRIEQFLAFLAKTNPTDLAEMTLTISAQAENILEEDFRNEVMNLFEDTDFTEEDLKSKVSFVSKFDYVFYEKQRRFLESHWERIDEIIKIIRYMNEQVNSIADQLKKEAEEDRNEDEQHARVQI